jgi:hypothetical protein
MKKIRAKSIFGFLLRSTIGSVLANSLHWRMKAVLKLVSPSTNLKFVIFFTKRNPYFADNFATNLYVGFLNEVKFKSAFTSSLHGIRRDDFLSSNIERLSEIEWRAHIVCWAANKVQELEGDFVDCGVWKGILPKTICDFVNFATLPKTYFLVDPWGLGLDSNVYTQDIYDEVKSRFAEYPNVKLIRGLVPEALTLVDTQKVAYLAIDMNGSIPERAALDHFYPKMTKGGVIYFDDYGWNYPELRATVDEFLGDKPESLLHFPNGTAILIKH